MSEQLTIDQMEAYVREHTDMTLGSFGTIWFNGLPMFSLQDWQAAYDFTKAREEAIRQRENQYILLGADNIDCWKDMAESDDWSQDRAWFSTLWVRRVMVMALIESALAELRKGMR